ncbi:EFR1 family ferrodoxin [Vallitalea okinawensis]|uniref:EFR1 family ferrodoxin n=1 Tax=Vallitalea okinawensis TaxID=2078660 RepID=UPI000CFD9D1D|nr:EFR1 family ferrodoxin [Vallitalea okinawensis]
MKSVVVYYFSGTGNTEIVANMLKKAFEESEVTLTLIRIEDIIKNNLDVELKHFDSVGIGCPIIGYGAPNIVYKFINMLPKERKKVFIFRTAGGVGPINYNASKRIMSKLHRKGYEVFYERVFSISSNWVIRFDNQVIKQLYEATDKKVRIMCNELIHEKNRILKTGISLRILMELVMHICPWIIRLVGKDFVVNNSCSHCGLCINNCPSKNIYKSRDRIRFKLSCNSCMRCVYSCPQSAINFRFLTFFPVAGGYNIENILQQSNDGDQGKNGQIPPFFYDYIDNDDL